MDIAQILISGVLGALAWRLGQLTGRKWITGTAPKDTIKRTAVQVLVLVSALGLSQVYFFQSKRTPDIQAQMHQALDNTPGLEIFRAVRRVDPAEYERLTEEFFALAQSKDPDAQAKAAQIVREATGRYFDRASDEAVAGYLKTHAAAMNALAETDPLFVCRLENPQVYGPVNAAQLAQLAQFPLDQAMENVIRSALQATQSVAPEQRDAATEAFAIQYQTDHPQRWNQIISDHLVFTQPELRERARAFAHFYETLADVPMAQGASVFRKMRQ